MIILETSLFFLINKENKDLIENFINEKNIENTILLEASIKNIDQIKTADLKNILWSAWQELLLNF